MNEIWNVNKLKKKKKEKNKDKGEVMKEVYWGIKKD